MKKVSILLTVILALTMCCKQTEQNPFFVESTAPHGTFRFDQLKNEHFKPAFDRAMAEHKAEIEAIINNTEAPTFENTIVALERSGSLFNHVASVFFALDGAESNEEMAQVMMEVMPLITNHSNEINLNEKLFERVKAVYETRETLNLNTEESMLLENTFKGFADNGANLSAEDKETYKQLSEKLSLATMRFKQNSLNETNAYSRLVTDSTELAGMPAYFMEMTAANAKAAGKEGWLLDLKATCYSPLLTFADNRALREEIWRAFSTQCLDGEFSNIENIKEIINTRLAIANLFGCKTYAEYALKNRMAEKTENVENLLNALIEAYTPVTQAEVKEMQEFAKSQGADFELMPWDWSYYAEKLQAAKFDLNEEMTKPYFELESVKKGVFGLATKLYGLNFTKNTEIPVYHPEVDAYEVTDENGNYVAVLYTDFHPRAGKRAGAWMTEYKGQWRNADGTDSRPHITIVMNFTRATESTPALLTFDEVETFLHEFGHAIHGMVSNCTYLSISGTNVYRDFVELPSQIMENWATEKEFLDGWARHYQTGEAIPAELIQKLVDASNFNCGYACLRQVSFGLQDMAFHTITEPFNGDPCEVERTATAPTNFLPNVEGTGRCTTFNHIFSGGYAAGYYSYKWAEQLDADAFAYFKQNGIFDRATAKSFLDNVLSRGGTEHPMTLYKRFRGQEPTIDAMLERNGIKR